MANLESLKLAAGKAAAVRKEMEAKIKELEAQIAQEKETALAQVNDGMEEFQDEYLLIAGLAPEGMVLLVAPRPSDGALVPMFVPIKASSVKKSSTKTGTTYGDKKKEYTVTVEGVLIPDVTTAGAIRRLAIAQEDLDEEAYCEEYNNHGGKCDTAKGLGNFPGWALNGKEIPMLEEWGIICEVKEITVIVPVAQEPKAEEPKAEEKPAIPEVEAVPVASPDSVMALAMALTGKEAGKEPKEKKVKS